MKQFSYMFFYLHFEMGLHEMIYFFIEFGEINILTCFLSSIHISHLSYSGCNIGQHVLKCHE